MCERHEAYGTDEHSSRDPQERIYISKNGLSRNGSHVILIIEYERSQSIDAVYMLHKAEATNLKMRTPNLVFTMFDGFHFLVALIACVDSVDPLRIKILHVKVGTLVSVFRELCRSPAHSEVRPWILISVFVFEVFIPGRGDGGLVVERTSRPDR